jgi:hypothetical protein
VQQQLAAARTTLQQIGHPTLPAPPPQVTWYFKDMDLDTAPDFYCFRFGGKTARCHVSLQHDLVLPSCLVCQVA